MTKRPFRFTANVARCWAYETAVLLDEQLDDQLPYNDYLGYYGPDYRLHLQPSNMDNYNTPEYLNDLQAHIMDSIRHLPCAPSVQIWRDEGKLQKILEDSDDSDDDVFDERICSKYLTANLQFNE